MNDFLDIAGDDYFIDDEESNCIINIEDYTDLIKTKSVTKKIDNKNKDKNIKKGKEASYIEKMLKDFDYKSSVTWKKIQNLFSTGIRHTELISIAQVLMHISDVPKISRSCHRSFPVLIKWFDDNWDKIESYIYNISLLDENKNKIDFSREMYDHIKTKIC